MTFQERALLRSKLAAKLLEAVSFGEENIKTHGVSNLILVHQRQTMKEVARELLQMK